MVARPGNRIGAIGCSGPTPTGMTITIAVGGPAVGSPASCPEPIHRARCGRRRPVDRQRRGSGAASPPVVVGRAQVGQGEGPRAAGGEALGSSGHRDALGLRCGPSALRQCPSQPVRRVRLVRPAAAGRLPRSTPYPSRLLRGPLLHRRLLRRPGDGRLDRQAGRGGGDGSSGVRRTLRRHRVTAGGDRVDGNAAGLRTPGRRRPTDVVGGPPPVGLGARRRHLHPGLHDDLAHPVARRSAPPPGRYRHGGEPTGGVVRTREWRSGGAGSRQHPALPAARPVRRHSLPTYRRGGQRRGVGQAGGSGRVDRRQRHSVQRGDPRAGDVPGAEGERGGGRDASVERVDHLRRQCPPGRRCEAGNRGPGIDPLAGPPDLRRARRRGLYGDRTRRPWGRGRVRGEPRHRGCRPPRRDDHVVGPELPGPDVGHRHRDDRRRRPRGCWCPGGRGSAAGSRGSGAVQPVLGPALLAPLVPLGLVP